MPKQTTADILRAARDPVANSCSSNCANVGNVERIASGALLATVGLGGLTRGSWKGLLAAGAGAALIYRGASGWCGLYDALGIDTARQPDDSHASLTSGQGVRVEKTVVISQPPAEVYRFWRALRNLPQVMSHLESVQEADRTHSHWIAKGPLGVKVEWDAEIIEDNADELIAWRSVGDSAIAAAGSVHFEPTVDGSGTEIRVLLRYAPPLGKLGASLANCLGASPEEEIAADLAKYAALSKTPSEVTDLDHQATTP
jgi:uncharacterized membrane protein